MPTADQIPRAKHLRALIIGDTGAGKTDLAATAPNPAFADYDNGMRTLASSTFTQRHPDVDLTKIKYETFSDATDEYGLFIGEPKALIRSLEWLSEMAEDDTVETLVFDTLTSMSALAMNVGLQLNANQGGKSKTLLNARANNKAMPFLATTFADIGAEMGVVQQIFDKATSASIEKHVIVLAHTRETKDKEGTVLKREALITGDKLRGMLGRWFDEVWYLDVLGSGEDAERVLYTASDATRKLKSRSGLPAKIENPTFDKILKLLEEV